MGKKLQRLVVGLTVSLIAFISYSSQISIIWPWYGREVSVDLLFLLGPFNLLLAWLWANYWLCVLVDPGRVPEGWTPDARDPAGYEVKKLTGQPRFCRTCATYKPPRTHHCKTCQRCVLRMDHHCPWIGNCVGHRNYGHFIRFLCSVVICCSYHLAMVTSRVLDGIGTRYFDEPSNSELVFIVLNYTACIPVVLAVGAFSLYHLNCLFQNTTTIEGWEKEKSATLVRKGKIQEVKFPYNLGRRKNIVAVFGENPLWWCCPMQAVGDGTKFEVIEGGGNYDPATSWPPRDPAEYSREWADETHQLVLPESPWTYNNDMLNPDLHPLSNKTGGEGPRQRRGRRIRQPQTYAVPPYHPDYDEGAAAAAAGVSVDDTDSEGTESPADKDDYYDDAPSSGRPLRRRGSEGLEVRPIDREAMLRQYVEQTVQEYGRYERYLPESISDSDDENEDNVPLAQLRHS